MNKAVKVLLGTMIVSGIVLCVLLVIMLNKGKGENVSKLKEFQELLESGAITQEEFDQLKKDILFRRPVTGVSVC